MVSMQLNMQKSRFSHDAAHILKFSQFFGRHKLSDTVTTWHKEVLCAKIQFELQTEDTLGAV